MTTDQLLAPATRSLLSQFLAEMVARADLPPLQGGGEDQLFLQGLWESTIDAFWTAYVSQLSSIAQEKLVEAGQDETGEKLGEWLEEFANFDRDEGARLLAQEIMEDFRERLPQIISEAYEQFTALKKP